MIFVITMRKKFLLNEFTRGIRITDCIDRWNWNSSTQKFDYENKYKIFEWYCPRCKVFYHQSESFDNKKSFEKWIKSHMARHKLGLLFERK